MWKSSMSCGWNLRELAPRPPFVLIDHMLSSFILICELADFVQQAILIVAGVVPSEIALLLGRLWYHGPDNLHIRLDTGRNVEMEATEE